MGIAVIAAFMATAGKSRERLLQAAVLALVVLVFGRYGLGFDPAGSVYGGY